MTTNDPLGLVGTTISEKYEIERFVAEGGFAVVYKARHNVWNRPVALKVFRAFADLPAERRQQLVESFIEEGRLLADLSSRSAAICQARDVGTMRSGDGREMFYMVLEWLEGRTLDQVIDDERRALVPPRTADLALRLLEPAAEALALAHRKGIVHRDVKPGNIFVIGDPREEFSVKLLDFGIAKLRSEGDFTKTQGIVTSFTPAYGAPEQFSRTHGATGPWTDVFALGLIFTELMTHSAPLRGDDLTQLAFASMDPRRRPTPRTLGADVTDAIEGVLRRALAVNIAERYQSLSEFWEALRNAMAMEPLRTFAGLDSHRSLPRPDVTALAPHPHSLPTPPPSMPFPGPPSRLPQSMPYHTLQTPGLVVPEPRSAASSNATLAILAGAVVIFMATAGGVAVWAVRSRGREPVPSLSSTPPPVPVPVAPPVAPPAKVVDCPAGMTTIPAGKFFMGSDDKKDEEKERPAHQVTLSAYCIDTFEVTVAAYKACSDRGECKRAPRENEWPGITAKDKKLYDPLCNIRDVDERGTHPINCVDWDLATAFCAAAGKRLPTEAEWEFATRGSDGRRYPWGDEAPTASHLNACGKECVTWGKKNGQELDAMYEASDGWVHTAPVGSFPKGASPFGLQDVVGNVFEWVADWYGPYEAAAATNPTGPSSGAERVMRGGAWNGEQPAWVQPTYRFSVPPNFRSHGIGFRCAKDHGPR